MDFNGFSKEIAGQVNIELKRLLQEWREEVGKTSVKLLPLVGKFIDSCQGGKRLRGTLVKLGYQIAAHLPGVKARTSGGEKEIIKVAAAYEILHSAILAHDDIIDKSLQRRGQPSLYQMLGGNHYGISQAICLGDAGFFLALKIINESKFKDEVKNKALTWFCQVMLDTALGQMLDVAKQDPLKTAILKTARYTISGPLVLGAIIAGENPKLQRQLENFGENLGVAFQIKDDILDAEADCWGGVDQAGKEAEKYKNQALKVLPGITKDKEMSKLLIQMAGYLVQRTK